MKKIILIVVAALFTTVTFAQRTALNESISLIIPKNAEKLNQSQAQNFAKQKFVNNVSLDNIGTDREKFHYKIDDLLISLYPSAKDEKVDTNILTNVKQALDETFKQNNTYKSVIKTINGNEMLIRSYRSRSGHHFSFLCLGPDKSRYLSGTFNFNKTDQEKGTGIANKLVESITFKN